MTGPVGAPGLKFLAPNDLTGATAGSCFFVIANIGNMAISFSLVLYY